MKRRRIYEILPFPISQLEVHSQAGVVSQVHGAFRDLLVYSSLHYSDLSKRFAPILICWLKWIFLIGCVCFEIDLSKKYMNERAKNITAATVIATTLAIPLEGIRQVAYYDPPGVLTVCRGHTGSDIDPRKKYSLAECDQYLTVDMKRAIAQVDHCVPDLPVSVLAAFGDAAYNIGPAIACSPSKSTAAKLLANGKYKEACQELPKWNKARVGGVLMPLPGLTKRRNLEMQVCLEGLT